MKKTFAFSLAALGVAAAMMSGCDNPKDDPVAPNPPNSVSPSAEPSMSLLPSYDPLEPLDPEGPDASQETEDPDATTTTEPGDTPPTVVDPDDCRPQDDNCPDLPNDGN